MRLMSTSRSTSQLHTQLYCNLHRISNTFGDIETILSWLNIMINPSPQLPKSGYSWYPHPIDNPGISNIQPHFGGITDRQPINITRPVDPFSGDGRNIGQIIIKNRIEVIEVRISNNSTRISHLTFIQCCSRYRKVCCLYVVVCHDWRTRLIGLLLPAYVHQIGILCRPLVACNLLILHTVCGFGRNCPTSKTQILVLSF